MKRLSRRHVLRAGAAGAIALPWLEAFTSEANAASAAPLRFVVVMHGNGVNPSEWFPSVTGAGYTLGPSLEPLSAFKDRMLVLKGVHNKSAKDQQGNPHSKAAPHLLTGAPHIAGQFDKGGGGGFASSISFDQELALHIQGASPIPSLLTGASVGVGDNGETCRARISYAGYNKPLTPQDKPAAVLEKLISHGAGAGGGAGEDPDEIARLLAERRSVLELAARDIEALMPKLGSADNERLAEHLSHLRAVEQSLSAPPPSGGGTADCELPQVSDGGNLTAVTGAMFELIAFALRCDLTRVATFQWSGSQSTIDYSGVVPGVTKAPHHQISHDGPIGDMGKIARYHSEQLALLLNRLDQAREGDRSVLDNTIVLYVNDLSEGSSHSFNDLPIVLVGGKGRLAPGASLAFNDASQNDLFIALAQAFGVDLPTFGDARYLKGALSGIIA